MSQLDQNIPVVKPAIALKCPDPCAGKRAAQTAVEEASFLRAGSNLTVRAPRVDIELV
jgi:hypothetical protein